MRNKICFLIFFIFVCHGAESAENYPSGARALSLSNAFVSISDTWSTFHNQAGLAGLESFSAGVFYESRFMVDELSHTAGSFVIPIKSGTFGISFSQFGKGTYKEHKIGLAFAKSLSQKISAAIQLDYLSERFPENERAAGFVTFEAGIVYAATEELFLGAHIFNPIQGGIKTAEGVQKMPALFRIGGHYQFPKMVLLIFETEKNFENPLLFKSGLEFSPVKNLALRFGVSGKPVAYTAGVGFQTGKITTDIGFSYHGNLGITPSVSIRFAL
jgi:hypothetical protein